MTNRMRVVAIVPARAGSQGLPGKNARIIAGRSLLERAIDFGMQLDLDDVYVTTDSQEYANIAISAGATAPGLRGPDASGPTAMEPSVVDDLNVRFAEHGIEPPDVVVWLRPTFVFRSEGATRACVEMVTHGGRSAARVVTAVDPRLYRDFEGRLVPTFDDQGVSMMRRQGLLPLFHVFNVDVFRWPTGPCSSDYLGRDVGYAVAPKLCGVDIDSLEDALIAEALLETFGSGILP